MKHESKRIILGISGASGVILGYHLAKAIKMVKDGEIELHMVVSDAAKITWKAEMSEPFTKLTEMSDVLYDYHNIGERIASGSYKTMGMIICPCSMKTLAGIVTGYTDNLLLRAADVCMKENRKLILCPREMPLGKLHLRNLNQAADLGCVIIPPMLSFYSGQTSIEDQMDHIIGKILMQFDVEYERFRAWEG